MLRSINKQHGGIHVVSPEKEKDRYGGKEGFHISGCWSHGADIYVPVKGLNWKSRRTKRPSLRLIDCKRRSRRQGGD